MDRKHCTSTFVLRTDWVLEETTNKNIQSLNNGWTSISSIVTDTPDNPKMGDIVGVKYKDNTNTIIHKGILKNVSKCFKNSVTIGLFIDKLVNIKISKNGSVQISGCGGGDYIHLVVRTLYERLSTLHTFTGTPVINYTSVMCNICSNLGFAINKVMFVNKYRDIFKDSKYSVICSDDHAAIRIKQRISDTSKITCYTQTLDEFGNWKLTTSYNTIDECEKYHTFFVFPSGRIIHSGPSECCMTDSYTDVYTLITNNRNLVEHEIV